MHLPGEHAKPARTSATQTIWPWTRARLPAGAGVQPRARAAASSNSTCATHSGGVTGSQPAAPQKSSMYTCKNLGKS